MNKQTLFDSELYQRKEAFDIAAVSRLYNCNKIPATELVQELLDEGLLTQHWKRSENNRVFPCFVRRTNDRKVLTSDWNSRYFYTNADKYQQYMPKWY